MSLHKLSLSFSGCGFLGIYHLGVCACLREQGGVLLSKVSRFAGASAGALSAAILVTAADKIEDCASWVYGLAEEVNRKPLGAMTQGFKLLSRVRTKLVQILPDDAHLQANGKLSISITSVKDSQNYIISEFESRDDLIQCLICSCYIPVYGGLQAPLFRGMSYMDGGLTNNLPRFEDGETIPITPFSGSEGICPQEPSKYDWTVTMNNQKFQINFSNVLRGAQALFPPSTESLKHYYHLGYNNTLKFLQEPYALSIF